MSINDNEWPPIVRKIAPGMKLFIRELGTTVSIDGVRNIDAMFSQVVHTNLETGKKGESSLKSLMGDNAYDLTNLTDEDIFELKLSGKLDKIDPPSNAVKIKMLKKRFRG